MLHWLWRACAESRAQPKSPVAAATVSPGSRGPNDEPYRVYPALGFEYRTNTFFKPNVYHIRGLPWLLKHRASMAYLRVSVLKSLHPITKGYPNNENLPPSPKFSEYILQRSQYIS